MDFLFFQVAAINGFDPLGHYLRAGLILNACSHVRDRQLAGLPGELRERQRLERARRVGDERPGYADTRRSASLRKLDAYFHGKTLQLGDDDKDASASTRAAGTADKGDAGQRDGDASSAPAATEPAPPPRRPPRPRPPRPRTPSQPQSARRPGRRPGADAARLPARERRLMRRGSASIAANPVLIGAATTLVVIVAVFLAYNANNGPAVRPDLRAQGRGARTRPTSSRATTCASAARASAWSTEITPVAGQGRLGHRACCTLKLETTVKPLPVDSTVLVRPRSALGLKYVEITKGTSSRGLRRRRDDPAAQRATPEPVEIDEFLNMFDDKTRAASQSNLTSSATRSPAAAPDLNRAIEALNPLLPTSSRSCATCPTRARALARLVRALGRTAAIVAPVAETQAALFGNLDTTFARASPTSRARSCRTRSAAARPRSTTAIEDFPQQRPFLANSEGLFRELRPGVRGAVDRRARPRRRARRSARRR